MGAGGEGRRVESVARKLAQIRALEEERRAADADAVAHIEACDCDKDAVKGVPRLWMCLSCSGNGNETRLSALKLSQ